MMSKTFTVGTLLLLAGPPLFATGCGGNGSTGNGVFGGTTSPSVTAPSVLPGAASGNLQPNAAPLSPSAGAASGGSASVPGQTTANGPLAPLSGAYVGTWAVVPNAAGSKNAAPAKSATATGGAVTLKISYPAHASKSDLGDVSGTWTEPALGGTGRISGTINQIGLPSEPNAVHVVGNILFPSGKNRPLVVELAEAAVGHLEGATDAVTISLKKTR